MPRPTKVKRALTGADTALIVAVLEQAEQLDEPLTGLPPDVQARTGDGYLTFLRCKFTAIAAGEHADAKMLGDATVGDGERLYDISLEPDDLIIIAAMLSRQVLWLEMPHDEEDADARHHERARQIMLLAQRLEGGPDGPLR